METWEGGFIHTDAKGRKVYVIRRMINGKSYKVSTRAGNLRAAMEQFKRFEADPEGYNPAGAPHEAPIYLDAPLAEECLVWNRDVKKTPVSVWRSSSGISRGGRTSSRGSTCGRSAS